MRSIEIDNIKGFTDRLFAGTDFDEFQAVEADFSTACTIKIDGHINEDFIGEEDMKLPENEEGILLWKKLRPICFEVIKGKKTPKQFNIVLRLPDRYKQRFIAQSGVNMDPDEIAGLFLNINFKQGKLYCVTGCSLKTFTLDKSLEFAWDEYMEKFVKRMNA